MRDFYNPALKEITMIRFCVCFFALVFSSHVFAGAIWTNYQLSVPYKNAAKVATLMENYTKTDAGKSFPGLVFLNAVVANGNQKATHNLAIVYKNEKQWEERRAAVANDKEYGRMMAQLNNLAEFVSETVYEHVGGYGLAAEDTKQWIGVAANVKDEARYLEIVDGIMRQTDPAASIDFWAARAGADPGVTHVVTIGVQSRADYNANPEVRQALAQVSNAAKDVRTIIGINYVDNVMTMGPLTSADMR